MGALAPELAGGCCSWVLHHTHVLCSSAEKPRVTWDDDDEIFLVSNDLQQQSSRRCISLAQSDHNKEDQIPKSVCSISLLSQPSCEIT